MAQTAPIASPSERLTYIDLYRGLAILAVVGIHVCGATMGGLKKTSGEWLALASVDMFLQFAVHAFLMISACLLTRNLLRKFDFGRYVRNRLQQALVPYLLWGVLYLLPVFTSSLPSPKEALFRIVFGKAHFHLYFLFVILQLYIVLPLLLPLWRKRPPLWAVLPALIALTLGIYWGNYWGHRLLWRLPSVGSVIFWYTPAVGLGMWLGSQMERMEEILQRGVAVASVLAAVSFGFYLPFSLAILRKEPLNTFHYQVSSWVYVTSASFVLLWAAFQWGKRERGVQVLNTIGLNSMQIYLIHPIALFALKKLPQIRQTGALGTAILYYTCSLALPLIVAQVASRLKISHWLFGR